MADLRNLAGLKDTLVKILDYMNKLFGALYGATAIDVETIFEKCKTLQRHTGAVYLQYHTIYA
jgi:hypothetical protein